MTAIEFIINYSAIIGMIEKTVKPELLPAIEKLKEIDPHDLVTPDSIFINNVHANGYVFTLFLSIVEEM